MRRYLEPNAHENIIKMCGLYLQQYLVEILQPCTFILKKRRQVEN